MEEIKLTGQVEQSQIDAWKASWPNGIYAVECKGRIGYFKNPDVNDTNYALSKESKDKRLDKWKAMADVTWLGGCDELLTNDRYFLSIIGFIQAACDGEESKLVNL